MKIFKEFKEFITRGNVIDMAVGLVIGSAFTAIVKSLVDDVIMPAVGALFGNVDFTSLRVVLAEATEETEEVAIRYGAFIQAIVNFLLIALVIFLVVRSINKIRALAEKKKAAAAEEEAPAEPEPTAEEKLLTEIRDLLKENK